MRKVLEDFYYGNITPGEKEMRPGSELHRAVDTAARCESQLAEGLDEVKQTLLTKLVRAQHEIDSITATENFILGFRLKLKTEVDTDGVVIRYKDFVIVAEFLTGPSGEWFATNVYRPIETEEETGEDFMNLRLENVTEWGGRRYGTEGEALRDGMDFIEWKF